MNSAPRDPAKTGRLALIDDLRGLAALAVVVYHVPPAMRLAAALPRPVELLFRNGQFGVDVFFVLSGFVISLSVANSAKTFRFLGRFALRRSIRLDPPYWFAMLVEVALGVAGMRWLGAKAYPIPNFVDVLSHVTYTQDIFARPQISDVFWTLCFEIQFYLCLVTALVLAHSTPLRRIAKPALSLGVAFVLVSGASVAIRNGWIINHLPGFALIRAQEFLIGCLCFVTANGVISRRLGFAGLALLSLARILGGGSLEVAVTTLTFGLCYLSFTVPESNSWVRIRPVQFLGKISYSLYLFHASVVGRASTVALSVLGGSSAPYHMVALMGILFVAVVFSYFCYLAIEQPSLWLSRNFRVQR